MAVSVTYDWQFLQNIDLAVGPVRGQVDVTSLANGGFAAVGVVNAAAPSSSVSLFNASLGSSGSLNPLAGGFGSIDQLANGNLVVVTNTVPGDPALATRFAIVNGSGGVVKPLTSAFVNGGTVSPIGDSSVAALAFGGFVIVTHQGQQNATSSPLFMEIYDSAGTFVSRIEYRGGVDPFPDRNPAVVALDDGGFAVAWEDYNNISFTRSVTITTAAFNADGTLRGTSTGVTSFSLPGNSNIEMCATDTGYAVISNKKSGGAIALFEAVLTTFDSSGLNPVTNTVSDISGLSRSPAIARMPDGLLAISYEANTQAGSAQDTVLKLYDPATNQVLSTRIVTAGEPLTDQTVSPEITGYGRGQLAVFHTNLNDNDVDGEALRAVRTHAGDAANDAMFASNLSEVFLGGGGRDYLFYADLTHAVTVNLSLTTTQSIGNGKLDRLSSIEDIYGTNFADTLTGSAANNEIDGGIGADVMRGGAGDDVYITPGAGDQIIELAGEGEDTVSTTQGSFSLGSLANIEHLQHGSSNDFVGSGNALANRIQSSAGADTLYGLGGRDTILAGDGNDILSGGDETGAGDVRLAGEAGADRIYGGLGDDRIEGGDDGDLWLGGDGGADIVYGGLGNDRIDGGADNDTWLGGDAGADTITGGLGNDRIDGGADGDVIYGDAGNDVITGGDGFDTANGGDNDDIIYGQAGGDTLSGGLGADTIYGGDELGNGDTLNGEAGADFIAGGNGIDVIHGGSENDKLYGDVEFDSISGGSGNDRVEGGTGSDYLFGEADNDYILGGAGVDRLFGGAGIDNLYGNDDADELNGDGGSDNLTGGLGLDHFKFDLANGSDTIFDFTNDQDTLFIDPLFGFANAAAVVAATIQTGTHARILLPGADTDIFLWNYLAAGSGNTIGNLLDDILIA